jgi:cytochrome P450
LTSTEPPIAFPFFGADLDTLTNEFARLRQESPICPATMPTGDLAYLVTRHADAQLVFADPRFSANLARPGAARFTQGNEQHFSSPLSDPPQHTRWRKLLNGAFTTRQVDRIIPQMRLIADDLIDAMVETGGPADLMRAFAYPFPFRVVSEVLGIPDIDQWHFKTLIDRIMAVTGLTKPEKDRATTDLLEYGTRLIAMKRANMGDDLASALIAARDEDDGKLDDDELLISLLAIVGGGYENVAKQIGRGVLALFQHPDQLKLLRDDPGRIAKATEELLRFASMDGGYGPPRYALADVEVGGVTVPMGASLIILRQSANRDETLFAEPDRFDISRESANRHLAFGFGPHHCVGATLARAELHIALERLLARLPDLRLAVAFEDVPWEIRFSGSGPTRILVTW